jgi:hypothetical protein
MDYGELSKVMDVRSTETINLADSEKGRTPNLAFLFCMSQFASKCI